jgi:hypothetical protein
VCFVRDRWVSNECVCQGTGPESKLVFSRGQAGHQGMLLAGNRQATRKVFSMGQSRGMRLCRMGGWGREKGGERGWERERGRGREGEGKGRRT